MGNSPTDKHEASCATASSSLTADGSAVAYWVLGFVSGMNTDSGAMVGNGTDTNGLLGEVKLYCDAHPSASIFVATALTYRKLLKERR